MSAKNDQLAECLSGSLSQVREKEGSKAGAALAEDTFAMLSRMRSRVLQGKMFQPESTDISFTDNHSVPALLMGLPALSMLAGSCERVFNMPTQESIKEVLANRVNDTLDMLEQQRPAAAMSM